MMCHWLHAVTWLIGILSWLDVIEADTQGMQITIMLEVSGNLREYVLAKKSTSKVYAECIHNGPWMPTTVDDLYVSRQWNALMINWTYDATATYNDFWRPINHILLKAGYRAHPRPGNTAGNNCQIPLNTPYWYTDTTPLTLDFTPAPGASRRSIPSTITDYMAPNDKIYLDPFKLTATLARPIAMDCELYNHLIGACAGAQPEPPTCPPVSCSSPHIQNITCPACVCTTPAQPTTTIATCPPCPACTTPAPQTTTTPRPCQCVQCEPCNWDSCDAAYQAGSESCVMVITAKDLMIVDLQAKVQDANANLTKLMEEKASLKAERATVSAKLNETIDKLEETGRALLAMTEKLENQSRECDGGAQASIQNDSTCTSGYNIGVAIGVIVGTAAISFLIGLAAMYTVLHCIASARARNEAGVPKAEVARPTVSEPSPIMTDKNISF